MIPIGQNSEVHITQIKIENEVKLTEIKTSMPHHEITEIPKHGDTKEQQDYVSNAESINNDVNNLQELEIDTVIQHLNRKAKSNRNAKKMADQFNGGKTPSLYPSKFWVQFSVGGGDVSYDTGNNTFVLIVFSLTAIMLTVTAILVGLIYYVEDLRATFLFNMHFFLIVGTIGLLAINYALVCSACARWTPCGIILLVFTVIFMSMVAASITVWYRTDIVLIAVLATIVTVILCMFLACTDFDFTSLWLYVVVISVAFMAVVIMVSLVQAVTGISYRPLHIGILIAGTLINIVVLIMELQMILGGRTLSLSENDYALGAYLLYTSIVSLFLKLLQLFGIFMSDMDDF